MTKKSHRVSSADFNKLVQTHRPNILAYAMMLSAGDHARDAVVLKSMAVLWERRKEYRPSEWPDFCGWCYSQIADQVVFPEGGGDTADFADQIRLSAAEFLPATAQRMSAFDKAFFSLPAKDKEMLSISCQHNRLQDQYISDQKGWDRDRFKTEIEKLKLSLLVSSAWIKPDSGGIKITPAEDLVLLRYVAQASEGQGDSKTRNLLLKDERMLTQYFQHVALHHALICRLIDGPGSQLRDGEELKPRKKLFVYASVFLLLLFPLLFGGVASESVVKNHVKAVAHSVIPEPSSVSLLAVGLGALLMRRSRDDKHG